ncbi:hypothetical protein ACOMHN_055858 [Nucella lapillus]
MDKDMSPDSDRSADSGVLSQQSLQTDHDAILLQSDEDMSMTLHNEEAGLAMWPEDGDPEDGDLLEEDRDTSVSNERCAHKADEDGDLLEEDRDTFISNKRCAHKADEDASDESCEDGVYGTPDVDMGKYREVAEHCTPTVDAAALSDTHCAEGSRTVNTDSTAADESESSHVSNDSAKQEKDHSDSSSLHDTQSECRSEKTTSAEERMVDTNGDNASGSQEKDLSTTEETLSREEGALSSDNADSSLNKPILVFENDGSESIPVHDTNAEEMTTKNDSPAQDTTESESVERQVAAHSGFPDSLEQKGHSPNTENIECSLSSSLTEFDSASPNDTDLNIEDAQFLNTELFIEESVDTDRSKNTGSDITADTDVSSQEGVPPQTVSDDFPEASRNKAAHADDSEKVTASLSADSDMATDIDTDTGSCCPLPHDGPATEGAVADTVSANNGTCVAETVSTDCEQGPSVQASLPAPPPSPKAGEKSTDISDSAPVSSLLQSDTAAAVETPNLGGERPEVSDAPEVETAPSAAEPFIDEGDIEVATADSEEARDTRSVSASDSVTAGNATLVDSATTVHEASVSNDENSAAITRRHSEDTTSDGQTSSLTAATERTDRRKSDTDIQALQSLYTDRCNNDTPDTQATQGASMETTQEDDSQTPDATEQQNREPTQTEESSAEKPQILSEEEAETQRTDTKVTSGETVQKAAKETTSNTDDIEDTDGETNDQQTVYTAAGDSTQLREAETAENAAPPTDAERSDHDTPQAAESHTVQTTGTATTETTEQDIAESPDTETPKSTNNETPKLPETERSDKEENVQTSSAPQAMDTQTNQREKGDRAEVGTMDTDTPVTQTCGPQIQTSDTDTAEESLHTDTTEGYSDAEKTQTANTKDMIQIPDNTSVVKRMSYSEETEETGTIYPETAEVADAIEPMVCHVATCSVDPLAILDHDVISGDSDVIHVNADVRSVGPDGPTRTARSVVMYVHGRSLTYLQDVHTRKPWKRYSL